MRGQTEEGAGDEDGIQPHALFRECKDPYPLFLCLFSIGGGGVGTRKTEGNFKANVVGPVLFAIAYLRHWTISENEPGETNY